LVYKIKVSATPKGVLMKTVILAGGFGTRFSEETFIRPKPLIEIGSLPIICHLMDIYSTQGFNEFILCLGYKSEDVKNWFLNYYASLSDFSLDFKDGTKQTLSHKAKDWKVTFVDTGDSTNTAGRVRRISHLVKDEKFFLTYADGLGNIDLKELLSHHNSRKENAVTLTATPSYSRFGELEIISDRVHTFEEKGLDNQKLVNSGFFVVEPKIFNMFDLGDDDSWEKGVLEPLTLQDQLGAYKHLGFWKPMDTLRDKRELESLITKGETPWLELGGEKVKHVKR
jgi:glucose-1-phosphate cytidylyltransferase